MRVLDFSDGFESATQPTELVASEIPFTPTGTIAATDVQAALAELDSEKVAKITSTDNAVTRFDGTTGVVQNSGVTIDDSNNVIIPGNLTVQGTQTHINSTTVDSVDPNVTLNKGGNDAASVGAGLTIDRTSTKGSLIFDATTATKFKLGLLAAEVEVADISTAQTLTNKSISGVSNTISAVPASALTGQAAIANGGTGAATKAAGFDALSPMSASGDIIYGGTSGTGTRLAKGSDTQILTLVSGLPAWVPASAGFANPMTTKGDIIGTASGAAVRIPVGTDGQALVADSSQTNGIKWKTLIASTQQLFTTGTAATYTRPAGCILIKVTLIGGGGGGGGCATGASTAGAGGGGGGGGTCVGWIASPASTYTYTVGTGGAGGSAGNNDGTAGNDTTFSTLTANGGGAGLGSAATATASFSSFVAPGGVFSGQTYGASGGAGTPGIILSASAALGGAGGGTLFSLPNVAKIASGAGNVGNTPGGGGGGGCQLSNGGTKAGGTGGAGRIIVEEFYQ